MSLRIVYAGTPAFAVPALEAMIETSRRPVMVMTQPDRGAGRGRVLKACPVKEKALEHQIPVFQPQTLKGVSLAEWSPDLVVTAAYGLLIPQTLLSEPRLGWWNLHASLLPRWRGASPIQQAILAGDDETGISLMQMDPGLDTGPVLMMARLSIGPDETGAQLHDRLAQQAAALLMDALDAVEAGHPLNPIPQPSEGATHAPLIRKQDAHLDWSQPAEVVLRAIRAYNPWPVAYTDAFADRGEPLVRIWAATLGPKTNQKPGTILGGDASGIVVACGSGSIGVTQLQAPGRRPLSAEDWLNAHPDWR